MINTNELMIGNYIKLSNGCIKKVEAITGIAVSCWNNKNKNYSYRSNKSIHPIPITEEILKKCGFNKCENLRDNWFINDSDDKIFQLNEPKPNEYELVGVASSFKYLHELQNLYFLYRHKQLEINL